MIFTKKISVVLFLAFYASTGLVYAMEQTNVRDKITEAIKAPVQGGAAAIDSSDTAYQKMENANQAFRIVQEDQKNKIRQDLNDPVQIARHFNGDLGNFWSRFADEVGELKDISEKKDAQLGDEALSSLAYIAARTHLYEKAVKDLYKDAFVSIKENPEFMRIELIKLIDRELALNLPDAIGKNKLQQISWAYGLPTNKTPFILRKLREDLSSPEGVFWQKFISGSLVNDMMNDPTFFQEHCSVHSWRDNIAEEINYQLTKNIVALQKNDPSDPQLMDGYDVMILLDKLSLHAESLRPSGEADIQNMKNITKLPLVEAFFGINHHVTEAFFGSNPQLTESVLEKDDLPYPYSLKADIQSEQGVFWKKYFNSAPLDTPGEIMVFGQNFKIKSWSDYFADALQNNVFNTGLRALPMAGSFWASGEPNMCFTLSLLTQVIKNGTLDLPLDWRVHPCIAPIHINSRFNTAAERGLQSRPSALNDAVVKDQEENVLSPELAMADAVQNFAQNSIFFGQGRTDHGDKQYYVATPINQFTFGGLRHTNPTEKGDTYCHTSSITKYLQGGIDCSSLISQIYGCQYSDFSTANLYVTAQQANPDQEKAKKIMIKFAGDQLGKSVREKFEADGKSPLAYLENHFDVVTENPKPMDIVVTRKDVKKADGSDNFYGTNGHLGFFLCTAKENGKDGFYSISVSRDLEGANMNGFITKFLAPNYDRDGIVFLRHKPHGHTITQ